MKSNNHITKAGFTLLELLVVIAIIGILAGLIIPTIMGVVESSKERQTKSLFSNINTGINEYKNDFGLMPPDRSDHGSKELIDVLSKESTRGKPYFSMAGKTVKGDKLYSPFGVQDVNEIHYQRSGKLAEENLSNSSRTPENYYKQDLWTADGDGNPKGLNNWE